MIAMKLKLFFLSILLLILFVAYQKYAEYSSLNSIDSYESCAMAKGSIIRETFPAVCITKLGSNFTEIIESVNPITSWNIYTNPDRYLTFEYPQDWKYKNGKIYNPNESFGKKIYFLESDFTYWQSINYLNLGYIDSLTSTSSKKYGTNKVVTTKMCRYLDYYINGNMSNPQSECESIDHIDYKDVGFVIVDLTPTPIFIEEGKIYDQILASFKFTD
jgi:hypothetical protein